MADRNSVQAHRQHQGIAAETGVAVSNLRVL